MVRAPRVLLGFTIFLFSAFLLPTRSARAQYMYMDANGDGIWSTADALNANGTPTTVDVWIDTNHSQDGSLAVCDTGDGDLATWNSYAVHINALNGTVSYSNFVNDFPAFTLPCSAMGTTFQSNETEMATCEASGAPTAGGLQKMFTMTVTGITGTPKLEFVPLNSLDQNYTSFGTPCSGKDFDNTLKLGSDWFEAAGLGVEAHDPGPPVISPIPDLVAEMGGITTQAVVAQDWWGHGITLRLVDAPSFATLTVVDQNDTYATAMLRFAPGLGTLGAHTVTIGASDGTTETMLSFEVTVEDHGIYHAPQIDSIPDVTLTQGEHSTIAVRATDVDGDSVQIRLIHAPGYAVMYPLHPAQIFITPGARDTSGMVVVGASDGILESTRSFHVQVIDRNFAPTAYFDMPTPYNVCAEQGHPLTLSVSGQDPDGDPVTASLIGAPPWVSISVPPTHLGYPPGSFEMTLSVNAGIADSLGIDSILLHLEDPFGAANNYKFAVRLNAPGGCHYSTGGGGGGYCTICASIPWPPVAVAGGPYSGAAGVPVHFDGSRSGQGDPLPSYSWSFGDGATATGTVVDHVYDSGGDYRAVLSLRNLGGTSSDTTLVHVLDSYPIAVQVPPEYRLISVPSSRPRFECTVAPGDSAFASSDMEPSTFVLRSKRTGGIDSVACLARSGSPSDPGQAMTIAFSGEAVRRMFSEVRGKQTITATLEGRLRSGAWVRGTTLLTVVGRPAGAVTVWPNPLNPSGTLQFEIARAGLVSVRIYSVDGRLVRELLNRRVPAGPVSIPFDGKDAIGAPLGSGVYFYRIEGPDLRQTGRLTLLK